MARIIGCAWGLSLALSGCVDWATAKAAYCEANSACEGGSKVLWQQRLGGAGLESVNALAISGEGDALLGGFYTGNAELGGAPLPIKGQQDLFLARFGSGGEPLWSVGVGGSGAEQVMGVTVDGFGNALVTGDFSSASLPFSSASPLARQGSIDAFAAQFTAKGALVWAVGLGGVDALTFGRDVAVVPSTGVGYLTGSYRGTVAFGATSASSNTDGLFLAQLSSAGTVEKLLIEGTCDLGGGIRGDAIALDSQKNVYLAGQYQGVCRVSGHPLAPTPVDAPGLLVLKLSPAGTELWRVTHPDLSLSSRVRIAADRKDNLLLTAGFKNTLALAAGGVLESQNHSTSDVLVLKLARLTGAIEWARAAGGPASDLGRALAVDGDNTPWVAGTIEGAAANFGSIAVTGQGQTDAFLAHYSETGEPLLAEAFGDSAAQAARGVAVDRQGLVLAGEMNGTLSLESGGAPLLARGTDLFLARLRP